MARPVRGGAERKVNHWWDNTIHNRNSTKIRDKASQHTLRAHYCA